MAGRVAAVVVVVVFALILSAAAAPVKKAKKGALDPASTHYLELDSGKGGRERFFCLARGRCRFNTIQCPQECPKRVPKNNNKDSNKDSKKKAKKPKVTKGCFADCSSRCETTCKYRIPDCNGYGSVCYDPRFVGGDGVMFYFHGAKGGDFALVSDDHLQINGHFIGFRPEGRARDFTWVQALAVMFETHTIVIAANKVASWDDSHDALSVRWDGNEISLPADGEGEWRANGKERQVVVERTAETNSVRVTVAGLVGINVKVTPIGDMENRTHGYGIPAGDAFAHLEMQFKFGLLTEEVEGILGQTYRPDYVSPVKKSVAMPMMGGEDRYRIPSLLSTICTSCRFAKTVPSGSALATLHQLS